MRATFATLRSQISTVRLIQPSASACGVTTPYVTTSYVPVVTSESVCGVTTSYVPVVTSLLSHKFEGAVS